MLVLGFNSSDSSSSPGHCMMLVLVELLRKDQSSDGAIMHLMQPVTNITIEECWNGVKRPKRSGTVF